MHVVERWADWAVRWRSQPIAPEVAHHARRALVDWHAALYPGAVVAAGDDAEEGVRRGVERGYPRTVALINGTAAHTVEVDDIYRDGIYHPGAPTIAAAHALGAGKAELPARDHRRLRDLDAHRRHDGPRALQYWHNTGTIGCFGACAAAAEVLA